MVARRLRAIIGYLFLYALAHIAFAQTGPDNVSLQIERLKSPNAELRLYAADALAKFEDRRAVEPLIAALRDSDPRVRARAADGLGSLKDARGIEPLILLLRDDDEGARFAAEWALEEMHDPRAIAPLIATLRGRSSGTLILAKFGPAAIEPLLTALKDKDPSMRRGAARALLEFPEPGVFAALEATLHDPDTEVRQTALLGLTAKANPRREEIVRATLHDPNPAVRSTALQAVSWIREARMADAVIAALSDPDQGVKLSAAVCLRQADFQDPRATEPLIRLLKDPNLYRDSVQALGASHDPRAADALIALASGTGRWDDRVLAIENLGPSSEPRATEVLVTALQGSDMGLQVAAAEQLGKLRDPRAVAPLAAAVKDPRIGNEAITALGMIGPPAAKTLIGLLDDPRIRYAVITAMINTKDPSVVPPLIALLMTPYPGKPQPYGGVADYRADTAPVRPGTYSAIIDTLGKTGDERAISPLIEYMKNGPIARDRVPQALFDLGPPSIGPLIPLLQDPNEKTRQLAAKALDDLAWAQEKDSRPRDALMAALSTRDTAVIAGAYQFYVGLGAPGSEDALVAALDRFGDEQMAEYFLNCGNVALEDAAFAWGEKRRFHIGQQVYGVVWGKMLKKQAPLLSDDPTDPSGY
jgi:HEAT repeat protein